MWGDDGYLLGAPKWREILRHKDLMIVQCSRRPQRERVEGVERGAVVSDGSFQQSFAEPWCRRGTEDPPFPHGRPAAVLAELMGKSGVEKAPCCACVSP